jgi:hypothetical protein
VKTVPFVAVIILLALALYCLLTPAHVLGAPWTAWVVSAAMAWAVGKLLDSLGVLKQGK